MEKFLNPVNTVIDLFDKMLGRRDDEYENTRGFVVSQQDRDVEKRHETRKTYKGDKRVQKFSKEGGHASDFNAMDFWGGGVGASLGSLAAGASSIALGPAGLMMAGASPLVKMFAGAKKDIKAGEKKYDEYYEDAYHKILQSLRTELSPAELRDEQILSDTHKQAEEKAKKVALEGFYGRRIESTSDEFEKRKSLRSFPETSEELSQLSFTDSFSNVTNKLQEVYELLKDKFDDVIFNQYDLQNVISNQQIQIDLRKEYVKKWDDHISNVEPYWITNNSLLAQILDNTQRPIDTNVNNVESHWTNTNSLLAQILDNTQYRPDTNINNISNIIRRSNTDDYPDVRTASKGGALGNLLTLVGEGDEKKISKTAEIVVGDKYVIPTNISQKILDSLNIKTVEEFKKKLGNRTFAEGGTLNKTNDSTQKQMIIYKDNIEKEEDHISLFDKLVKYISSIKDILKEKFKQKDKKQFEKTPTLSTIDNILKEHTQQLSLKENSGQYDQDISSKSVVGKLQEDKKERKEISSTSTSIVGKLQEDKKEKKEEKEMTLWETMAGSLKKLVDKKNEMKMKMKEKGGLGGILSSLFAGGLPLTLLGGTGAIVSAALSQGEIGGKAIAAMFGKLVSSIFKTFGKLLNKEGGGIFSKIIQKSVGGLKKLPGLIAKGIGKTFKFVDMLPKIFGGKTFTKLFTKYSTKFTKAVSESILGKLASSGTSFFKNVIGKVAGSAVKVPGLVSAGKMFKNLGSKVLNKLGLGALTKLGAGGILKGVGAKLAKKLPFLGTILGGYFAYKRFKKGDYLGAAGEMTSGLLTLVPGLGTAASIGVDLLLMATDWIGVTGSKEKEEKPKIDPEKAKNSIWEKFKNCSIVNTFSHLGLALQNLSGLNFKGFGSELFAAGISLPGISHLISWFSSEESEKSVTTKQQTPKVNDKSVIASLQSIIKSKIKSAALNLPGPFGWAAKKIFGLFGGDTDKLDTQIKVTKKITDPIKDEGIIDDKWFRGDSITDFSVINKFKLGQIKKLLDRGGWDDETYKKLKRIYKSKINVFEGIKDKELLSKLKEKEIIDDKWFRGDSITDFSVIIKKLKPGQIKNLLDRGGWDDETYKKLKRIYSLKTGKSIFEGIKDKELLSKLKEKEIIDDKWFRGDSITDWNTIKKLKPGQIKNLLDRGGWDDETLKKLNVMYKKSIYKNESKKIEKLLKQQKQKQDKVETSIEDKIIHQKIKDLRALEYQKTKEFITSNNNQKVVQDTVQKTKESDINNKNIVQKVENELKKDQRNAESTKKEVSNPSEPVMRMFFGGKLVPGLSIIGEGKGQQIGKDAEIAVTNREGRSHIIGRDTSQKIINETKSIFDDDTVRSITETVKSLDPRDEINSVTDGFNKSDDKLGFLTKKADDFLGGNSISSIVDKVKSLDPRDKIKPMHDKISAFNTSDDKLNVLIDVADDILGDDSIRSLKEKIKALNPKAKIKSITDEVENFSKSDDKFNTIVNVADDILGDDSIRSITERVKSLDPRDKIKSVKDEINKFETSDDKLGFLTKKADKFLGDDSIRSITETVKSLDPRDKMKSVKDEINKFETSDDKLGFLTKKADDILGGDSIRSITETVKSLDPRDKMKSVKDEINKFETSDDKLGFLTKKTDKFLGGDSIQSLKTKIKSLDPKDKIKSVKSKIDELGNLITNDLDPTNTIESIKNEIDKIGGKVVNKTEDVKSNITDMSEGTKIDELIKHQIKVHEGVVLKKYKDSLGYPTVGVGHLIKEGENLPNILNYDQVMKLYDQDYEKHKEQAEKLPTFNQLNKVSQGALIDMVFNMGLGGVQKFRGMFGALKENDYDKAAEEALDSRWATQVGSRADRIAKLIKTGDPSHFNTGKPQVIAQHGAYFTGNGTAPINAQVHPNEMVINGGQFENFLTKIIKSVEDNIKSIAKGEKNSFDNLLGKEKELRKTDIERKANEYQERLNKEKTETSKTGNNQPVFIDRSVHTNNQSTGGGMEQEKSSIPVMTEVEDSLDRLVANLFSPTCIDNPMFQIIEKSVFESPNQHFFY